jgi:2'-5' RNA ligase superfamily
MAGALIVTAEIAQPDFSWLEDLRRSHYPPERNQVPAHLTIFHGLPPSAEAEARSRLASLAKERAPRVTIEGMMDLGGGVAYRIVSPDLDRIREGLANALHGLLGAQDNAGWRPHITIQNKVPPKAARALIASLERDFAPRPLAISGLGLHRYVGGRWERIAAQVERCEAGLEHGGEHRLIEQLGDRSVRAFADQRLGFLHGLVPIAGFVGPLTHPAESDDFGQLILAEVLERGLELFFDAVVDRIVEDRKRAFLLVVDIVGGFVAVIIGRGLRLIFARPKDDAAQRVERGQRVHSFLSAVPLNESRGKRFLALTG